MGLSNRVLDTQEREGECNYWKDQNNKSFFILQNNEEKRLSLNTSQAKLTYHRLNEFGYKLRKPKIETTSKD